jgi:transposase
VGRHPPGVAFAPTVRQPGQQATLESYLHAPDLAEARIERLERETRALSEQGPWRELVARLRCLRGVDTLTAVSIAVEVGDFSRFKSAEEFMAYVRPRPLGALLGAAPQAGVDHKVGNSYLRRLLVESAWNQRGRPQVGAELARRQRGQDPLVIERAWRCQQRLHRRWRRM